MVLVHLNHRLVQMCLRLLRAEVWAQDDVKKLHRVTVRSVPDALIDAPTVVVISRLVVTGGNHHRLHEELTVAGGYLGDKSFRREEGVTKVQQWLDQAKPLMAADSLFNALRMRFDRAQSAILHSVDARSKDRLKFLTNTLQSRKQQEVADIGTVLDELEKAIQLELKKTSNRHSSPCSRKTNEHSSGAIPPPWKRVLPAFQPSANRKPRLSKPVTPNSTTAPFQSPLSFLCLHRPFREVPYECSQRTL
ncbi:hypothetical protein PUV44_23585 [Xanthomonas arboricola pv. corylina]|nr:hypothetical protein PUV44_23585 [Xanthomonas arboricola pv. corylina]